MLHKQTTIVYIDLTFYLIRESVIYYTPTTKCVCGGGGYTGFALSRRSVGRSVSNSCPLYNYFTNGRISFKLE